MNKTGFVVSFIIIIIFIVGGFFFFQKSQAKESSKQTQGITTTAKVASTSKTFSMNDVAMHANRKSCWTTIDGKVYDLTSFISRHPGGPFRILRLCGKDGSVAFNAQHGGRARPANELSSLYIGDLASQ